MKRKEPRSITIAELVVRTWDRQRRARRAHHEGKSVNQVTSEEGTGRLARLLAGELAPYLVDELCEGIEAALRSAPRGAPPIETVNGPRSSG